MTSEEQRSLVDRYRTCVEEVPPCDVDQTILAAARRQSAIRRSARRMRIAFLGAAVAAIAISFTWKSQQLIVTQTRGADYGKTEGTARSYLLNATTPPYSGAGITEGTP